MPIVYLLFLFPYGVPSQLGKFILNLTFYAWTLRP